MSQHRVTGVRVAATQRALLPARRGAPAAEIFRVRALGGRNAYPVSSLEKLTGLTASGGLRPGHGHMATCECHRWRRPL